MHRPERGRSSRPLAGRSGPAVRRSTAAVVLALVTVGLAVVGGRAEAQVVIRPRAAEVSGPVMGSAAMPLPFPARHIAVHWAGNPEAQVAVALSTDGVGFGPESDVGRDEVGEQRGDGETYGAVLPAEGATAVRVTSDRPLGRATVLALADGERVVTYHSVPARPAGASVAQPEIVPRSGWGADESLRFNGKREVWPPTFWSAQKLFVHHTAGANGDADPAATVRAIYYYHAVTQGWGDIGYSFLIDESGRIYKGRHSHTAASSADTITGEDELGRVVTAGHAYGFNNGTVGVALLGTLTNQDAAPAARSALVDILSWKADRHGIDPTGSALYTNPANGSQSVFPNIAGHRDVNATECPGGVFYETLPAIRSDVAARMAEAGSTSTTTTLVSTTSSSTTTTTIKRGRKPR